MKLLLNADVGEGLETDDELFPYLDQASIACGGHAGNVETMQQAVLACSQHGVSIGAHPSYPDTDNFGRISLDLPDNELIDSLHTQICALEQVCTDLHASLDYLKPHGALYNDMMARPKLFQSVLTIVESYPEKLALMIGAMPASERYLAIATQAGVELITEAFADRRYLDNGQLQPRSQTGAVLSDPGQILSQALQIAERGQVTTVTGRVISLRADSLCIHGDNPASVRAANAIARQRHA